MNISLLFNVFTGEISPLIEGRIDSPINEMGATRMENFIPMLTGGIRKRPGTWYDGNTLENKKARLIEWLLSDGTCILLELTEEMIRIWRAGDDEEFRLLETTPEIEVDYTGINLREIQYAASANTIWFAHNMKPVIKLEWNGSIVELSRPIFTRVIAKQIKVDVNCNECKGVGSFTAGQKCPHCNDGQVAIGNGIVEKLTTCGTCKGTGKVPGIILTPTPAIPRN